MTRIHLRRILGGVIAVYALALALGLVLRRPFAVDRLDPMHRVPLAPS